MTEKPKRRHIPGVEILKSAPFWIVVAAAAQGVLDWYSHGGPAIVYAVNFVATLLGIILVRQGIPTIMKLAERYNSGEQVLPPLESLKLSTSELSLAFWTFLPITVSIFLSQRERLDSVYKYVVVIVISMLMSLVAAYILKSWNHYRNKQ